MIIEHIIFSIAVAITIGAIVKRNYSYVLPVWIIPAFSWLPDSDYIPFHVFTFLTGGQWVPIHHSDFHNVFSIICLSLIVAYILNKTLKYNLIVGFSCAFLTGCFHIICDFMVYGGRFHPFVLKSIEFVGWNVIPETRSLLGIGEPVIVFWGCVAVLLSLIVHFYYANIYSVENPIKPKEDTQ